ncbi:hypothetical protein ACFSHQ_21700 [Gemmobacter lanyuensis]
MGFRGVHRGAGAGCGAETPGLRVAIAYLRAEARLPPTLSNLDPVPADLGIAGAMVALADTRTTGQFLGHDYQLDLTSAPPETAPLPAARGALAAADLVLVDATADQMLAIADLPEAQGKILFNVASGEGGCGRAIAGSICCTPCPRTARVPMR